MSVIRFEFPLPRPHAGPALGNGRFGVLAWGGRRLCLTVNRSDFWDRRHEQPLLGGMSYAALTAAYDAGGREALAAAAGARQTCWPAPSDRPPPPGAAPGPLRPKVMPGDFTPSRLPMGRFECVLKAGCAPARAELDLARGRLTVTVRETGGRLAGRLRLALHPDRPVLLVRDPARLIRRVEARPAWDGLSAWFRARSFAPPRRVRSAGCAGWVQACPADPAMAALRGRGRGAWWVAMERGETAAGALAAARRALDGCRHAGARALESAGATEWRAFWRRACAVRIPDRGFQEFFEYALFRFGAATSPRGGVPAGLQGPWIEDTQPPPWGGDYHFNVNVQQVYTLGLPSGQAAHLRPLFDMLDAWRPVLARNARVLFGVEDGLYLGMCTTDRGQLLYYSPGCVLDPMVSAWTAWLYWQYVLHTGDKPFLRARAFPFMEGVMRALEAMLEPARGGRRGPPWPGRGPLRLPLAVSPEFANAVGGRVGPDPSCQLAALRMLAAALIEASRRLGRPARPSWRAILRRLPPWSLAGRPGAERLAVWSGQDLTESHRHHSHLAALYPFDTFGPLTPGRRALRDRTLAHWISKGMGQWSEWGIPWAAILLARGGMGEGSFPLLRLWQDVFVNEGRASVYRPRVPGFTVHGAAPDPVSASHEIMQLDGALGAATALLEMLAHWSGGVLHVFPGVPAGWRRVAFRRIRLAGPVEVGAERADGRVRRVRIRHLAGGRVRLAVHGARRLALRGRVLDLPAELPFRPGETLELREPGA